MSKDYSDGGKMGVSFEFRNPENSFQDAFATFVRCFANPLWFGLDFGRVGLNPADLHPCEGIVNSNILLLVGLHPHPHQLGRPGEKWN